ncbi:MAG: carboxyl-terminal protease, partial [Acidobacteria bacterium]|nr:carboxyl-terminal protease [Acidobacteriota bacterium]
LAASLTGAGRAESVGQRTAGRVSLQKLIPLPDGSGLWLSWARYLHASGDALHRTGVEPDVAVEVPSVELGEPWPPGDPILDRALEHLQAETTAAEAA